MISFLLSVAFIQICLTYCLVFSPSASATDLLSFSSLSQAFNAVFHKAMGAAEWDEDVRRRVHALTEAITYSVFLHTSQGLFETDKLTFLSHTAFQVRDSPTPTPIYTQPHPSPSPSCHPHQSKHFSAPTLAPIKSSQQDLRCAIDYLSRRPAGPPAPLLRQLVLTGRPVLMA